MDDSFYVRVRGKPQGPYSPEQLQVFARRGQFSRLHEVSTDGVSWVRASSFPQLFTNDVAVIDVSGHGQPQAMAPAVAEQNSYAMTPAPSATQRPQAASERCYYNCNGVEHGPVDFSSLRALVASGKIGENDLVWIEGTSDWTSPLRIPGLVQSANHTQPHVSDGGGATSVEAARAMAGTRPWILFVAILMYVGAIGLAVIGMLQLIAGAKISNVFLIAEGLFGFVFAVLNGFHGYLLTDYWNRLGEAATSRLQHHLEAAMNAQRRYWLFVGIQAIVFVTFTVVGMIWAFAVGAALAGRLT